MKNRVPQCVFLVQLNNNIFPLKIKKKQCFCREKPNLQCFCRDLSRNARNKWDKIFQSGFKFHESPTDCASLSGAWKEGETRPLRYTTGWTRGQDRKPIYRVCNKTGDPLRSTLLHLLIIIIITTQVTQLQSVAKSPSNSTGSFVLTTE